MNTDGTRVRRRSAGIDMSQLFLAPTYARKLGPRHAGLSAILAYQRFEAKGLQVSASSPRRAEPHEP
jgi:hypothetical protein